MINIHIRKFYALTDVELNPGVGGSKILVDSVGGGNVAEVIKLAFGTEGNLTLVSAADELPVTDPAAASMDLKTPALGQAAMVASVPVAIASNQSAIPVSIGAGSAVIGHVINDAGAAIIGKVGIDQTTPGTTNGVQVNAALPAGSNVIGHVIVDASGAVIGHVIVDSGVITSVTAITNALPVGANIIGKVGIDQTTPGTTNGVQVNNTVTTTESSPSTIFNGKTNVTTSGTRVVLASSQVVKSVTIKALSTNTGLIYVGNSSVASTNGFQLSPGDTISMDLANLNTVNIDSAVNGEGVSYFAVA